MCPGGLSKRLLLSLSGADTTQVLLLWWIAEILLWVYLSCDRACEGTDPNHTPCNGSFQHFPVNNSVLSNEEAIDWASAFLYKFPAVSLSSGKGISRNTMLFYRGCYLVACHFWAPLVGQLVGNTIQTSKSEGKGSKSGPISPRFHMKSHMKNYDMMSDETYSVVLLLVFLRRFATWFLTAVFLFSFRIWIYFLRFISKKISLNLIGSFPIPDSTRMIPYNGGPLPKKRLGLGLFRVRMVRVVSGGNSWGCCKCLNRASWK